MKKLIGFLLLAASLGMAQNSGQNVVGLVVFNNRISLGVNNYTSGTLQNLGQSSHTVTIVTSQGVSNSSYISNGAMQGSMDGVYWFNIGPVLTNVDLDQVANPTIATTLFGYGAYPYLRLTVTIVPVVGTLNTSIYYTGISTPVQILSDLTQQFSKMQVISGAMASGGALGIVINGTPNQSIVVYGFSYTLEPTATYLQLLCKTAGGITPAGVGNFLVNDNANAGVLSKTYSQSVRPYGSCPLGYDLASQLSGTGSHSYLNVFYRYE